MAPTPLPPLAGRVQQHTSAIARLCRTQVGVTTARARGSVTSRLADRKFDSGTTPSETSTSYGKQMFVQSSQSVSYTLSSSDTSSDVRGRSCSKRLNSPQTESPTVPSFTLAAHHEPHTQRARSIPAPRVATRFHDEGRHRVAFLVIIFAWALRRPSVAAHFCSANISSLFSFLLHGILFMLQFRHCVIFCI